MRLVRAYISTTIKRYSRKEYEKNKKLYRSQLKEDQESEQLTLDLEDLFKKGKGKN